MDNKELEEMAAKYKARNKYINDYQKNNYDRIVVLFKPGTKKILEEKAKNKGLKTVSDYIKFLVDQDANTAAATLPGIKEPEAIKPEPPKNPYEGIGWEGDPLPFG